MPDLAIYGTAKKLVPPARDEGFDHVWRVTPDAVAGGEFVVEEVG